MPLIEYTVYISSSHDPWLNLAIENWLYQNLSPQRKLLFLYRNFESVVIGRFQNPWLECNVEGLIREGVPLVRRQSGGGTVYHDLGNTNYSFIVPAEHYDVNENYRVLLQALRRLGIAAERTERNDLHITGKKFSGSAFKKTARKVIHHGTLLHAGDKERLHMLLTASAEFIDAKGIRSVSSPIINLSETGPEVTHEALVEAVSAEFRKSVETAGQRSGAGIFSGSVSISDAEALTEEGVRQTYDEYRAWEWTFGKTPPFSQAAEWENREARIRTLLHTRHCTIDDIRFTICPAGGVDTSAGPVFLAERAELNGLAGMLQGTWYRREAVAEKCMEAVRGKAGAGFLPSFTNWLISQIYPS